MHLVSRFEHISRDYLVVTVLGFFSQEAPATGRKADVMKAAYLCAEAALRLVKPGNQVSGLMPMPMIYMKMGIVFLDLSIFNDIIKEHLLKKLLLK